MSLLLLILKIFSIWTLLAVIFWAVFGYTLFAANDPHNEEW
jgi:hypothetical protein